VVNWKVLEEITAKTSLLVDFGGGVKQESDVQRIIECGASWVTVGSMAAKQPAVFSDWLDHYGSDRFFLGADVRDEKIAVGGWLETTTQDVQAFISSYTQLGLRYIFCTDISKDGKLEGPAIPLYTKILNSNSDVQLVASGGVATIDDLQLLKDAGCHGAIIGKAIYENRITIAQLKKFIS
jgi:phosphoribosylformimino-5-aminoimidazole carboxamide ribotide isomerase